ncbi:uncharacterized protein NPIL_464151 [Nephila pilipes]|uniref:Uncharacterized protein n=1 Tax=Nephila pilipes TaxID=299642 RepID=A0A8X6N085_NEPPI|nr:uncharacterized protein NPIL_464151 [Nephila pilipes]
MDEALEVVDEGLGNLFTLMTYLSDRTKSIMLELQCLESFRKVFVSLNLFVVPVVIAIMLSYETRGIPQSIEAGFQMIVMFLMFVSGSVGLPFYIFSLWESFKISKSVNRQLRNLRAFSIENNPQTSPIIATDSLLSMLSNESSLDRLNDFARLMSNRMPDRMRTDLQRRRDTGFDLFEPILLPSLEESLEREMESPELGGINPKETNEEKQDQYFEATEPKLTENDFSVLYQFQVLMRDQSPDLSVNIKPANKVEVEEISKETAHYASNECDPLSNNNDDSAHIEAHLVSIDESSEEKNSGIGIVSPQLNTCKEVASMKDQLQNLEISC